MSHEGDQTTGRAEIVSPGQKRLLRPESSLVLRGLREIDKFTEDVNAGDENGMTAPHRAALDGRAAAGVERE
jgi:hypothetical protein